MPPDIQYVSVFFKVGHGETNFENEDEYEEWCNVAGE